MLEKPISLEETNPMKKTVHTLIVTLLLAGGLQAQNNYLWTWGITIGNFYNVAGYYDDNYLDPWPYTRFDPVPIITPEGNWIQLTANGGSSRSGGLQSDGSLWEWTTNASPDRAPEPEQYGTDTDWKQVCFSNSGRFALKTNGTLWNINNLTAAQWGSDTDWDTLIANPGRDEFFGIKTDGSLWQLENSAAGVPETITLINDTDDWLTASFADDLYAIKTNGTLWVSIDGTDPFTQVGSDNDWINVNHSGTWIIAHKANQTIWSMGTQNNFGQLGQGHNDPVPQLTQIGTDNDWVAIASGAGHTYALKTSGALYGWGLNNYRQLGIGNTDNQNAPVQIGTLNDWLLVASGPNHGVAVRANGFGLGSTASADEQQQQAMTIYPNPCTTTLWLQHVPAGNYEVFTIDGRLVLSGTLETSLSIDVSGLDAGTYRLHVEGAQADQLFLRQ